MNCLVYLLYSAKYSANTKSVFAAHSSCIHIAAVCRLCPRLVSPHYKIIVVIDNYRPLFCIYWPSISVSNTCCNCPKHRSSSLFPKAHRALWQSKSALQTSCRWVVIHFYSSTWRTRTKSLKQILTSYQDRLGHSCMSTICSLLSGNFGQMKLISDSGKTSISRPGTA